MSSEYEDDPTISAIYHKAGDLAPPSSLDDVILAAAKRAAWRRKQRWILPLSTAAVVVLSVTLLMNMSEEWDFSRDKADSPPTPQAPSAAPETVMAKKRKSSLPVTPPEIVAEEKSQSAFPASASAAKPAPAPTVSTMAKTSPTYTNTINTDIGRNAQGAPSHSDNASVQAARSKAESAGILEFSNTFNSSMDSQGKATAEREEDAALPSSEPVTEAMKQKEVHPMARKERIVQNILEPKPWIAKIRKLVSTNKKEEARKELELFKKHYPKYKLPDDLKSI